MLSIMEPLQQLLQALEQLGSVCFAKVLGEQHLDFRRHKLEVVKVGLKLGQLPCNRRKPRLIQHEGNSHLRLRNLHHRWLTGKHWIFHRGIRGQRGLWKRG